jgi:asparagine synthase (glutamine-hydrolysing)
VALTGDGGDEAFGGYDRYRAHAWARRAALPGVGVLARGLGALGGERRSRSARVARFLAACAAPAQERYARLVEVFPASLRRRLLEPEFVAEPAPTAALLGAPRLPGLAGLQLLDLERYLPDDLLLKADIASMAHSLELRSPFLDWEVLEVGISLPDALKLRGRRGKEALRRAFAEALPPPVASRAKSGFGVPLADWFRGELRDLAGDLLLEGARRRGQLRPQAVEALLREHARGRADHGHRLWCLLMLELWQRTHLEARPARAEALALR